MWRIFTQMFFFFERGLYEYISLKTLDLNQKYDGYEIPFDSRSDTTGSTIP